MRHAWRTFAALLAAALFVAVGCDSDEPVRTESRTASVSVSAIADGPLFHCYQVWQDTSNPQDGIPDVNTGFIFCEETVEFAQRAVPWRYSIQISVIPKGSTTEQIVTSLTGLTGSSVEPGDGLDDFVSLAPYDLTVEVAPARPHEDDIYFVNGQRVSRGSPVYLAALGFDLGAPNILTTSPSFDFMVNSGDTIIVRARKQSTTAAPPFLPSSPEPNLTISGLLTVGGVGVAVQGNTTSSIADQSGFTFSYTVP